jgi:hypothetical protein
VPDRRGPLVERAVAAGAQRLDHIHLLAGQQAVADAAERFREAADVADRSGGEGHVGAVDLDAIREVHADLAEPFPFDDGEDAAEEGGHQPGSGASQAGRMRPPSAAAPSGKVAIRSSRAAAQPGSGTASSSRKATQLPFASASPRFRARDRPASSVRSSRTPASAAKPATAAALAGGEALSTTSTSNSRRDWPARPARHARR